MICFIFSVFLNIEKKVAELGVFVPNGLYFFQAFFIPNLSYLRDFLFFIFLLKQADFFFLRSFDLVAQLRAY